jgi:hypothetical protein
VVEAEPQYKFSDRGFAYGLGRWEQDRILGYDARWNLSAGLGYKMIDSETLSLSLKGGLTWRQTDFTSGRNESEINALAGLDFGWQLSPTIRLTQVASTIVGERNTTASSLTALNAKLTGALSARIAYSAEIDSNPPPGIEKVDTLTRFTLVYGFSRRRRRRHRRSLRRRRAGPHRGHGLIPCGCRRDPRTDRRTTGRPGFFLRAVDDMDVAPVLQEVMDRVDCRAVAHPKARMMQSGRSLIEALAGMFGAGRADANGAGGRRRHRAYVRCPGPS